MTKKKWIIVFGILLTAILAQSIVSYKTNEIRRATSEAEENESQPEYLWNLEDLVSISHDGTLFELLERIESSSNFKINLEISETKREELNKNFTLSLEMKVYEIIGLACQSMGLKVDISDDFKQVNISE